MTSSFPSYSSDKPGSIIGTQAVDLHPPATSLLASPHVMSLNHPNPLHCHMNSCNLGLIEHLMNEGKEGALELVVCCSHPPHPPLNLRISPGGLG